MTFVSSTPGRSTLAVQLGGRIYTSQPPDTADYPFAVLRLASRQTGAGDDGRLRERGSLEVMMASRPRSGLPAIEDAMDTVEEALLHYHTDALGILTIRGLETRGTMVPPTTAENREVAIVRAVFGYTWWPDYRTRYAVSAGAPAPIS